MRWARASIGRRAISAARWRRSSNRTEHAGDAIAAVRRRSSAEDAMTKPVYRRVVVKVSGEALMGPDRFGIHQPTLDRIAADLGAARALGGAIGIVGGGG